MDAGVCRSGASGLEQAEGTFVQSPPGVKKLRVLSQSGASVDEGLKNAEGKSRPQTPGKRAVPPMPRLHGAVGDV